MFRHLNFGLIFIQFFSACFISSVYSYTVGYSLRGFPIFNLEKLGGQLVQYGFRVARIVPDILDTPPGALINVTYPFGIEVSLGNFLTPLDVKDAPNVGPWEADSLRLYTLIMLDAESFPDNVGNTVYYLHWLKFNIQGNFLATGSELVPYEGSSPPIDTGIHRYVFLIFLQPGPISPLGFGVPHDGEEDPIRMNFNLRNFINQYQLGNPIAGNFFRVKAESSLPTSQWLEIIG